MRRPGPELSAIATVCFLFFKGIATGAGASAEQTAVQFNQRIMGGTLVSSLAGEYSFAFALTLALFALGALAFSVRTGRRKALAAVLLAATVMSHVVVGLFAVVGALVIVAVACTDRFVAVRHTLGRGAAVGAVGALLTAFWTVPLVATFGYTANMRYEKLTSYLAYLYVDEFLWVYLLALVGLVLGIVFRDRATVIVASIAAIFALVFRLWPELHAWNLRFLPFWYLGVFLLAAIGAAEIVRRLSGELGRLWVGRPASPDEDYEVGADADRSGRVYRVVTSVTIIVTVVILAIVGIWFNQSQQGFLGYWAEWNETGYENAARAADPNFKAEARKQYPEYRALIDRMSELPPGRALWEGGSSIDAYGTPLALMLLPYWTHGRIQSFEGLYYESAASTPYVFMAIAPLSGSGNASNPVRGLDYLSIANFSDGVRYLRALGGRYYLAHSQAAKDAANRDPGLQLIGTTPDIDHAAPEGWSIYEVRDHALVAPLPYEPVVVAPHAGTATRVLRRAARHRPRTRARRLGVRGRGVVVEGAEPRPAAGRVGSAGVATGDRPRGAERDAAPAPAGGGDRRPPERQRHPVPRLPDRGAGRGADLLLPQLGGARCARSVAAHPEPHGRGAHPARRHPALRPVRRREGGLGGQRGGAGRPRGARDLGREAAPSTPPHGTDLLDHCVLRPARPVEAPARPGATMSVPPRGR